MSARVESDPAALASPAVPAPSIDAAVVAPIADDADDRWGGPALPADHPRWLCDTVSISQRARALLARVKPVVIAVAATWEHRARSIVIGGRRMSVDAGGSYRLD